MINALIIRFDDQGVDLGFWGGAEGTRTPDPTLPAWCSLVSLSTTRLANRTYPTGADRLLLFSNQALLSTRRRRPAVGEGRSAPLQRRVRLGGAPRHQDE